MEMDILLGMEMRGLLAVCAEGAENRLGSGRRGNYKFVEKGGRGGG